MITLGIIGVVAAMTLPTLIQNHQKQTLVNQLKKVVNTLENAAQMAVAQEGVLFKDTSLNCDLFNVYSCHNVTSTDQDEEVRQARLGALRYFKILSYEPECVAYDFKMLNGTSSYTFGVKLVFPDGSIVYPFNTSSFVIDVNGNKGPNTLGRDIFELHFSDNGNIIGGDRYGLNYCGNYSESQYLEKGCYYTKIVADGWKMNY